MLHLLFSILPKFLPFSRYWSYLWTCIVLQQLQLSLKVWKYAFMHAFLFSLSHTPSLSTVIQSFFSGKYQINISVFVDHTVSVAAFQSMVSVAAFKACHQKHGCYLNDNRLKNGYEWVSRNLYLKKGGPVGWIWQILF